MAAGWKSCGCGRGLNSARRAAAAAAQLPSYINRNGYHLVTSRLLDLCGGEGVREASAWVPSTVSKCKLLSSIAR